VGQVHQLRQAARSEPEFYVFHVAENHLQTLRALSEFLEVGISQSLRNQLLQLSFGRAPLAGGEDTARVVRRDGLGDEPHARVVGGAERGPKPEPGARLYQQAAAAGGLLADPGAYAGLPVPRGLLFQRRQQGLLGRLSLPAA
jgi:hypothetical protein